MLWALDVHWSTLCEDSEMHVQSWAGSGGALSNQNNMELTRQSSSLEGGREGGREVGRVGPGAHRVKGFKFVGEHGQGPGVVLGMQDDGGGGVLRVTVLVARRNVAVHQGPVQVAHEAPSGKPAHTHLWE